jgi:hypothetical protein
MTTPPTWLVRAVTESLPDLAGRSWLPLAGGRINRVWKVGDQVVKCYDPGGHSPLFPNDPLAEAQALRQFGPIGLSPDLSQTGQGWLAYRHVPGQTWAAGTGAVARFLHRLHGTAATGLRPLASGSAALTSAAEAILAGCRARLVRPDAPGIAPWPDPRPIHGDAVPGNLVLGPAGLVAIDWQCPALGDPAEDIATFLSPAMQLLYRGAPLSTDEVAEFFAAYPDQAVVTRYQALRPLFHWRMAAHCLWRAERGDPAYRAALQLELAQISVPIQTPSATIAPPASIQ